MKKLVWHIAMVLALSGCFSLKSPYERFIMNMNTTVSYDETIDEQASHSRFIRKEYLVRIEEENGTDKYHYKKASIAGGYCFYHFVVNRKTRKVIGWGFDENLGRPNKCGNSG